MKDNKIFYAVIVDAERYPADLGHNEVMAVFKHKEHAEKYGRSMWEEYYIIKETKIFMYKEIHDL